MPGRVLQDVVDFRVEAKGRRETIELLVFSQIHEYPT